MKVLDRGCGAGDTALLAAELVGPTGRVVGVDANAAILETARRRARAAGRSHVAFLAGDLRGVPLDDDVDALVGRLVPLPPARARRGPAGAPAPPAGGGVVAFHDLDLTTDGASFPSSLLHQQVLAWVKAALASGGAEVAAGTKLHRISLDAGLDAPEMQVSALMGGRRPFLEAFATCASETVRTRLPLLVAGAIATEEEVGIETLAACYRAELLRQGSEVRNLLFMGGWAPHRVGVRHRRRRERSAARTDETSPGGRRRRPPWPSA